MDCTQSFCIKNQELKNCFIDFLQGKYWTWLEEINCFVTFENWFGIYFIVNSWKCFFINLDSWMVNCVNIVGTSVKSEIVFGRNGAYVFIENWVTLEFTNVIEPIPNSKNPFQDWISRYTSNTITMSIPTPITRERGIQRTHYRY